MATNNSWNAEYNNEDGQLLIGSTSQDQPIVGTLTGGAGIVVTNGDGNITIDATKAEFWEVITDATHQMEIDKYYLANNAAPVVFTLPLTAAVGTELYVVDMQAGWVVEQNANQQMHFGKKSTTVGITGNITSTKNYDSMRLVCSVADTEWIVLSPVGNLDIN